MKYFKFLYLSVVVILFASFLCGCTSDKIESLPQLIKARDQMQIQLEQNKKEIAEVNQMADKYRELSDKYQQLVTNQTSMIKELQQAYVELDERHNGYHVKVLKGKLIEATQDATKLQERLKRYTSKARELTKKTENLELITLKTQEQIQKTQEEIGQIKLEIAEKTIQANEKEIEKVKDKLN